jgi:hypothetical protein
MRCIRAREDGQGGYFHLNWMPHFHPAMKEGFLGQ